MIKNVEAKKLSEDPVLHHIKVRFEAKLFKPTVCHSQIQLLLLLVTVNVGKLSVL